jgi:hypothetical protein
MGRHLQRRIEQQQHWRQADAVRDGREPASDPDAADLVEWGGELRRYEASGGRMFVKRLVDGVWD